VSGVNAARLDWYRKRVARMSAREIVWRAHDETLRIAWKRRQVHVGQEIGPAPTCSPRLFASPSVTDVAERVSGQCRQSLLDAADRIRDGQSAVLGTPRDDLADPDWFLDAVTGRRAPSDRYAFAIDHRDESETGNVKHVWELSRHHHLTVLAAAWALTRDDTYAEVAARQLWSWWEENPFLSGVHWTSGIEVALRLIAWTWMRRLLDGWRGAAALFEGNETAAWQLLWHQEYLSAFRSRGSSANNHIVAEAAGLLVASLAFPWYRNSARWSTDARAALERELARNTFRSGLNRELASGYHAFVAELALTAGAEADAAGRPLRASTWSTIVRMVDAAAALVDETGRPPRQGDSDDGRALVVDGHDVDAWRSVLAQGAALLGPRPWWPHVSPTVSAVVIASIAAPRDRGSVRPARRPSHFADAGTTILRTAPGDGPEIWCRCDGGPHGYLSIAAHAHADALSIEVRYGGVDVLADPGTYCYHGDPEWREYFRSTRAHNTVEVGAVDQSAGGGPFLWLRHAAASSRVLGPTDEPEEWSAAHDGYLALDPPARHARVVRLERDERRLVIADGVDCAGTHVVRLSFHLGPMVRAQLDGATARLEWPFEAGTTGALLVLPAALRWSEHRGETRPIEGWYSPAFGAKSAATTLVGRGECSGALELVSELRFDA
jgi:Heparinase II/III-like protein/Heparinase II/III N-terminus